MDIQAITGIFGIIAAITSGLVLVQYGMTKTLRETASDRGVRITDLEQELERSKASEKRAATAAEVLAKQLRNDDKIDALTQTLETHHTEAKLHWTVEEGILKGIADEITGGGK